MPGGDRTGPFGAGPMTGRGAGYCAGYNMPGYANPYFAPGFGRGRGFGYGRGFGRGWRNRYYATGMPGWARAGYYVQPNVPYPDYQETASPVDETAYLKEQAKNLERSLRSINKRLDELKAGKNNSSEVNR